MGAEFADLNITPVMPQEGQAGGGGHGEVEARQRVWRKEASEGKEARHQGESEERGLRRMSVANNRTINSICFRTLGQEPVMSRLRQVIQEEDV